ncbi:NUDIX domain-containing protein [Candidatus Micrarchaeota archaeon]|nr:NUDIX domain-containing protein [Candidatus Micrarchaeota archaeon]
MECETSCGIVVFREELPERLYLLLHYEEGHWDFPKGHAEEGEREEETAFRELKEEAGLSDIELVLGFREHIRYGYQRAGRTFHKEVFFFLGRTDAKKITLSHEHVGFEWLPFDKALERLTYENARGVLSKAQAVLQSWGAGKEQCG